MMNVGRQAPPRVVVAMSGGVDSSVAAALLKDQGYDVIGITMQIWRRTEDPLVGGCCSLAAVEDARRVAEKLGVPHHVLNFREPFARRVIDDFVEEYRRGHTPNPCVRCNQFIKFDLLQKRARELEAEYVATGHYARIEYDTKRNRWLLLRGRDRSKDQSYALYAMTQEQLAHALFPLGRLRKAEVRKIAEELSLIVARKPESQEICFVTEKDYREFLRRVAPDLARPGPILDTQGNVVGEHEGTAFYTIGQRKGLRVAVGQPRYVIRIDAEANAVVIGEEVELYSSRFAVKEMNLISTECLTGSVAATAAIRYNTRDSAGVLRVLGQGWAEFEFEKPQRAVTPGQAAVFYQGEEVLGGGTIADEREERKWRQAQGLTEACAG